MSAKSFNMLVMVMAIAVATMSSGCAVNFYKQNPRSNTTIKQLQSEISELESQREAERKNFEETKRMLEDKLRAQISDESVSLRMGDQGLVIILSDDVLFDSGKAELKSKAYPVLDKVSNIISQKVADKNIGVTGHTDNIPITHSGWKSNWELSTARATNVLHYMVEAGVSPDKLSATGYGEHKPIATNSTSEGRGKNRRVEIVILPEFVEERDANNFVK